MIYNKKFCNSNINAPIMDILIPLDSEVDLSFIMIYN